MGITIPDIKTAQWSLSRTKIPTPLTTLTRGGAHPNSGALGGGGRSAAEIAAETALG